MASTDSSGGQIVTSVVNNSQADDPYYVHPADNPGQLLVSFVFDGTNNFGSWKRSMMIALEAKCKEGFVDGTLSKPEETDPNSKRWTRCNAMVISWLMNSLTREIGESILDNSTACQMWNELCERYGQTNSAQLYQVEQQINELNQGTDSITTYYTKLKRSWDELNNIRAMPKCKCGCKCGASQEILKFEMERKVVKFLMGLNDSYKITRGGILQNPPLPSISTAYSILLQEERQRDISSQTRIGADASAFAAQKKYGRGQGGYQRGGYGGSNSHQQGYGREQGNYQNSGKFGQNSVYKGALASTTNPPLSW